MAHEDLHPRQLASCSAWFVPSKHEWIGIALLIAKASGGNRPCLQLYSTLPSFCVSRQHEAYMHGCGGGLFIHAQSIRLRG
eukprot:scaffold210173_cov36-Tisochrysis_lutea.AAC.2